MSSLFKKKITLLATKVGMCTPAGRGEHLSTGDDAQGSVAGLRNTLKKKTSHYTLDIQYFTIKRFFLFNVTFKNLNTQKCRGNVHNFDNHSCK